MHTSYKFCFQIMLIDRKWLIYLEGIQEVNSVFYKFLINYLVLFRAQVARTYNSYLSWASLLNCKHVSNNKPFHITRTRRPDSAGLKRDPVVRFLVISDERLPKMFARPVVNRARRPDR